MNHTNINETDVENFEINNHNLQENQQQKAQTDKESQPTIVVRDSRFELLRIICMVMIVFYHINVFGGYFSFSYLNKYVVDMFCFGKLGVNVFFIISGYFMAKSKAKFSKFVKLELQVIFYCCFVYLLYCTVMSLLNNESAFSLRGGRISSQF